MVRMLMQVLDEDGKDRTPKPLVQRSAAAGYTAGPGRADANPGNSTSGSTRQSRLSSRVSTMSETRLSPRLIATWALSKLTLFMLHLGEAEITFSCFS
jgi:hypothetical protein